MRNWKSLSGLRWALCAILFGIGSANQAVVADNASPDDAYPHAPSWVTNQTMYEVNVRQFSEKGDIEGVRKQLPRLKQLGVGILWIMPVNPIGNEGRSGQLGSEYAVKDYAAFNPEFGTLDQFKAMVADAHRQGLFVILDWVANHTALDHPWVKLHPDWYKHDAAGALVHPLPEWKDVIALDFTNKALRKQMTADMSFWVQQADIDGFRCDTAEWVALDYWCEARDALRKIKPIFMLAEGNKPELLNYAFDSAYAWNLPTNTEGIWKGTKNAADLANFIRAEGKLIPNDGFRLFFTSNHDKNSWEGTTTEQLGDSERAATVLTFTLPGMPLIYSGQENGDEHRLSFFERDPIKWKTDPMADFYKSLSQLKKDHRALWVGGDVAPAPVKFIDAACTNEVLTFERESNGERVLVMLNLSKTAQQVKPPETTAGMNLALSSDAKDAKGDSLPPWSYRVWISKK